MLLIDWCLTPTLAVFKIYRGVHMMLIYWCLTTTLAVFKI